MRMVRCLPIRADEKISRTVENKSDLELVSHWKQCLVNCILLLTPERGQQMKRF
jgi:hypothetical protein